MTIPSLSKGFCRPCPCNITSISLFALILQRYPSFTRPYFPCNLPFKYSAHVIGQIQSSIHVAVSWVVKPCCLANLCPNDIEAPGCSETSVHLNYTTRRYSPHTAVFMAITVETTNPVSMLTSSKSVLSPTKKTVSRFYCW